MINIIIIGAGNVAFHLLNVFNKSDDINVIQQYNRSAKKTDSNIPFTTNFAKIKEAAIYIIAINDDAIPSVSKQLKDKKGLIVHTSGSVAISILKEHNRHGSFYPLQTFSKDKEIDFSTIPVCIETNNKTDLKLLETLGNCISNNVQEISSKQRKSLHLAAVFANNFTNHLYHIANTICIENEVSFNLLKPLITETVEKLKTSSPIDAQTGPAKRMDNGTMKSHLEEIQGEKIKKIYTTISQSISSTYGKKL